MDRALEKDPGKRFQSGGELLAALRAIELIIASRKLIVDGRAPATSFSSVGRSTRLYWLLTVAAGLGMLSALTWGVLRSSDPQRIDDAASTAATASSLGAFQWAQRGYASLSRYDVPENVDRAIEEFRNAVTRDASNAYAHAGLAQAYQRKHSATADPQIIRLAAAAARHESNSIRTFRPRILPSRSSDLPRVVRTRLSALLKKQESSTLETLTSACGWASCSACSVASMTQTRSFVRP